VNDPKTPKEPAWRSLSTELRRRKVYSVVAAYAVIAFIVLQIAEITFEPLGIPNWVMIALIAAVVLGFPVAVALSWVYDLSSAGIRKESDLRAQAAAKKSTPSIAVLPFADMSPGKDQGFFCEGIAEEILNALTKIPQLNVAARSSSFVYSTGSVDIRSVGRELGVGTVLEGSVRKSGDRVRVTAQLVEAENGYHLWSKSFDEELRDVFAIQDEIATCIAESLLETLSPERQASIRTTSTTSVEAYEYYLRGRHFFKRFRKKDIEFARQMFRQAIDIDTDYAAAWAGYADCHSMLVMYVDPQPGYREEAYKASARAVELDPDSAEAHAARGLACLVSDDFESAEQHFEKALELNPQLFEAYYFFARTRFHQGRLDEAIELFRKAAEADPTDYQSRCLRIQILRGLDRMDEAVAEAEEALEVLERHLKLNPDDTRAYHLGAGTLVVLGQVERAKKWLVRAVEIDPDDPVVQYNVACNLATLGEIDKALEYLGKAIVIGTISADWMRHDDDLDNLRGDPRFEALMKKLKRGENRGESG
jgi:TolB-like protein/Flp pilus assembly protein TadD